MSNYEIGYAVGNFIGYVGIYAILRFILGLFIRKNHIRRSRVTLGIMAFLLLISLINTKFILLISTSLAVIVSFWIEKAINLSKANH